MTSYIEVRPGVYHDPVSLTHITDRVGAAKGVRTALVAMATPPNLDRLREMGFAAPEDTAADDMIVAIGAENESALKRARRRLTRELEDLAHPAALFTPSRAFPDAEPEEPRTVATAAARSAASVAVVSVPGEHAFIPAMDALRSGLSVLLVSEDVPVADEIQLKDEATRRGLLMLGPESGASVVSGISLGFANATHPGPVGIVDTSDGGSRQLICLLDAAGVGISHCLAVGARDLSADVAGRATKQALLALDHDPGTELIVVMTRAPMRSILDDVRALAGTFATPTRFAEIGTAHRGADDHAGVNRERGEPDPPDLTTVTSGILDILRNSTEIAPATGTTHWPPERPPTPRRGSLRGLFSDASLCAEATAIATAMLGPLTSGDPTEPETEREDQQDDARQGPHKVMDFGVEASRRGRPQPILDLGPRLERFAAEADDPDTGVLLIDAVLGYGAHADPAGQLAAAMSAARKRGSVTPVVVCLVGTVSDPQRLRKQASVLAAAGADVFLSNAQATRHAVRLVTGHVNEHATELVTDNGASP